MYKFIVVLSTIILMYLLISTFKKSKVTYKSVDKKYKYLIEISLLNGEKRQIVIFSDMLYTNTMNLLREGKILQDFDKKLIFNDKEIMNVVPMSSVLSIQMEIKKIEID